MSPFSIFSLISSYVFCPISILYPRFVCFNSSKFPSNIFSLSTINNLSPLVSSVLSAFIMFGILNPITIKTSIIIVIHTLLDCLITGSLNLYYFPFMVLGWLSIPLICCTFFKKTNSSLILGTVGIIGSLIFSWIFIIPNILVANSTVNLSIITYYLIADLPFEAILACSSFLSIIWLYNHCSKAFDVVLNKFYN